MNDLYWRQNRHKVAPLEGHVLLWRRLSSYVVPVMLLVVVLCILYCDAMFL